MRLTKAEMDCRREGMIHSAYQLFNEYGIDNVSLAKIAQSAGVSPKSVTRYFDNKAQLIEATQIVLWKETVDCITEGNQQARSESPTGLEEIKIILQGFETLYKEHSDYILFYYDYKSYMIRNQLKFPENHLEKILNDVRPTFLHALDRGQKDGSITTSIPLEERFLLLWGIMQCYVEQIALHDKLFHTQNPWVAMFPGILEKVLESLQA